MTERDTYRVLWTGSRDLVVHSLMDDALAHCWASAVKLDRRLVIVHGHCPTGADAFADAWAADRKNLGYDVDYERHPAQNHPTQNFGPWPRCGPLRNGYMVSLGANVCLAFVGPCTSPRCHRKQPHGSHGASGCAREAERAGIPVRRWDLWRQGF